MNSKKPSKRRLLREEQWHAENDPRVYFFLMALARPELAPALQDADRVSITELIRLFQECSPPLAQQDVMGLVVLRLTCEFWPLGKAQELDAEFATIQALALAAAVAPLQMQEAGFWVPKILHPQAPPRLLMIYALGVHQRWQAWHRELLDPYVPPATERHLIARGVARLHCLRQAAGEKRAARETKQLLDGYFRRTGRCKAILDIEDISAELYALGRGKVGKTGILRLREDGIVYFDPRAMRDALRKASLAAGGIGAEPENHLDQKALDAATSADEADLRAALLDQCDEIDQLIIENWDSTDVAVAKQVDLTPQAVGKRRKKILDMANRLRSRTRE